MRILYFVQYFNLPDEPGGSRPYQFARAWVQAGHEVTVVTGNLNHKILTVREDCRGHIVTEHWVDGIRALHVWVFAQERGSTRSRYINFLSYAGMAAVVGLLRAGRVDIVYASSTPLTAGLPGSVNSFFRRVPFFFEVRDLWPESAVVAGTLRRDALLTRMAGRLARHLYARAARVVGISRGILEGLIQEGVAPGKTLLVPNGVDDWMVVSEPARPGVPTVPFTVTYCGAHGPWNGLGQILDAAVLLRSRPGIEFLFIGDGEDRRALEQRARELELGQVRFAGTVPKKEAFRRLQETSCSIIVTWNHPFQKMVLANKIFDYLAAGRPVIVAADGEMADLVREAKAGLVVPPDRPDLLSQAVRTLSETPPAELTAMGEMGRRYILAHYQRASLAGRLLTAFQGTLAAKKYGRRLAPSDSETT